MRACVCACVRVYPREKAIGGVRQLREHVCVRVCMRACVFTRERRPSVACVSFVSMCVRACMRACRRACVRVYPREKAIGGVRQLREDAESGVTFNLPLRAEVLG